MIKINIVFYNSYQLCDTVHWTRRTAEPAEVPGEYGLQDLPELHTYLSHRLSEGPHEQLSKSFELIFKYLRFM